MTLSYQNNSNDYQQVHVHDEQHVRKDDESTRFWRNRRFIKTASAALVLGAVAWMASSLMTTKQQGSSANVFLMGSARQGDNKCHYSVVVDNRGVMQDGPGADGTCNDPVTWYHDQLIDHFVTNENDKQDASNKWTQKCFINDEYFRGPGHPIFFIMGGEGDANCIFYPFITHTLARIFGGMTLECEHRFYGMSQPIDPLEDVQDMIGLLTPDQAMADYLRFLNVQQEAYECSTDRSSPNYCPVVTVGASYPGFLAAMMRVVHHDMVDIAYASSAPLPLYAQTVDPFAYYDKVSMVADAASPGCAAAVKATLLEVQADLLLPDKDNKDDNYLAAAERLGICANDKTPLPAYIQSKNMLWHEIESAVAAKFADFNMNNYPPSPDSDMNTACQVFQNNAWDVNGKMQHFWEIIMAEKGWEYTTECFDFASQIPNGPRGTVTSADWTGGGDGKTGLSWDFQTCTDLVVQAGYGHKSMFPYREWTLEALTEHCQSRFGVDPTPTRMLDMWHFDDLVGQGASRIVFTNGLSDGWSADSILGNLSPDIIAINMPNGAHHSDLNHMGPRSVDTEDVKQAFPLIIQAMTRWLTEIKAEMHSGDECE